MTDLLIGGMTCAACVARVEKRLNRVDGVSATVNLATGLARITHPPEVGVDLLVSTVERAGYTAQLPSPPLATGDEDEGGEDDGDDDGRERLVITAVLAVPVLVLSMVPALQFDYWQWLCFTLAGPVVVWSSSPSTPGRSVGFAMRRPPWTPSSRSV